MEETKGKLNLLNLGALPLDVASSYEITATHKVENTKKAEFSFMMFSATLKNIKRQLPSQCTMLAPYKTSKGEIQILFKIKGEKNPRYLSTPEGLTFMQADIEHIIETITSKF